MHRRRLLKLASTAGLGALAGCWNWDRFSTSDETPPAQDSDPPDGTASPVGSDDSEFVRGPGVDGIAEELKREWEGRFESFVNMDDAGADVTGEDPIDDVLDSAIDDDTLIFFPTGTYSVGPIEISDVDNVGLVANTSVETTLVPSVPATEINHLLLRFLDVRNFLLDGLELDFRGDGQGGATQVYARGDFVVRNVRVRGRMPDRSHPSNPAAFRFDVLEESASGLVENVVARDGGHDGGNAVGIYVGNEHAGEITFENCEIENFPNNGLYASSPGRDSGGVEGADGAVHVEGGRYKNNNIANVRLGTTGSTARDVDIVVDEVPPNSEASTLNARGLRLRGKRDQLVENCRIVLGENAGTGFGALVFHPSTGAATIRDTEIRVDRDGIHAINALPPNDLNGPTGPTFENVTITGSASHGRAVAIRDRDGTEFRGCTIEQSGTERDGLLLVDSQDCVATDTTIRVPDEALQTVNSSLEEDNLDLQKWEES